MDCTICANETSRGRDVLTSAGAAGTLTEGRLPDMDPLSRLRWTALDIHSRARLDAALRAFPIPTGSDTGEERSLHAQPTLRSRATELIAHLGGREKALEAFGWTGRRAEWIALTCLHGGVFTRAQWTSFLGCHPEKVRRAVRALVAQGLAVEEAPAEGIHGIGRVCRIRARKIYRALGAGDFFRRRRITSRDVLMRRLLSLDYVLEHHQLPWLPTGAEKVAAFEALGIERRVLPQRTYRGATGNIRRHFHLGLPLALDTERAVFVYADPGHETATALRAWGAAHRELWGLLRGRGRKIEVVAVARGWEETSRADTVLGNWARGPRPSRHDTEIAREIERLEHVLRSGDVRLIREVCGDIRAGLVRLVELRDRARRRCGRGLLHRVEAWQTERLRGRLF